MSTVYQKSEQVSWKKLEAGKSILLDLRSGHYYTLNETATLIWEYLTSSLPVADVVQEMAQAFDTGVETMNSDVLDVVDVLTQKGFLCETDPLSEAPESDKIEVPDMAYVKPMIEEHEAVKEVTAGTDTAHYWYPN
jgi:hypothetical protein